MKFNTMLKIQKYEDTEPGDLLQYATRAGVIVGVKGEGPRFTQLNGPAGPHMQLPSLASKQLVLNLSCCHNVSIIFEPASCNQNGSADASLGTLLMNEQGGAFVVVTSEDQLTKGPDPRQFALNLENGDLGDLPASPTVIAFAEWSIVAERANKTPLKLFEFPLVS